MAAFAVGMPVSDFFGGSIANAHHFYVKHEVLACQRMIAIQLHGLTEHFHYWTKAVHGNAVMQPELFVEVGERLAKAKGVKNGDWVEISSQRGAIKAKAVVTKRLRPIKVDGKDCDVVGLPIHYGFVGLTKKGYPTNVITPSVGDASVNTPEYKAFLVDVKKTSAPATATV